MYSMYSVVLGLPPQCHRCKARAHLAYQYVACYYFGSDSLTSEEHSSENARRGFSDEVVGTRRNERQFAMEEEINREVGVEVSVTEHHIGNTQPEILMQILQESQWDSGEGKGKEGVNVEKKELDTREVKEEVVEEEESGEGEPESEGEMNQEGKEGEEEGGEERGKRGKWGGKRQGRGEGEKGEETEAMSQ